MKDEDNKRLWVIDYLKSNAEASVLNEDFHAKFYARFGGKRKETMFGSQPVRDAMAILSQLAKNGVADVRIVPLGVARQPGFPNWVRSYSLSEHGRLVYR